MSETVSPIAPIVTADGTTLTKSAANVFSITAKGVDTGQLADSAVETLQLNASAVETADIKDDNVTAGKLEHNLDATAIGFNAAEVEGKSAAQLGSMELMHYGTNSFTDEGEADLDTHTMSVNDFAAGDMLIVHVMMESVDTGVDTSVDIITADATFSTGNAYAGIGDEGFRELRVCQGLASNSSLMSHDKFFGTAAVIETPSVYHFEKVDKTAVTTANWITTAFTVTLRGVLNATGTGHFRWWVYRLRSA